MRRDHGQRRSIEELKIGDTVQNLGSGDAYEVYKITDDGRFFAFRQIEVSNPDEWRKINLDSPSKLYKLRLPVLYEFDTKSFILEIGEVCEYFEHSDTYLFRERDNIVPYFNRETVESHPLFFEEIQDR